MLRRGCEDGIHPQDLEIHDGAQLFDALVQSIRYRVLSDLRTYAQTE